MNENPQQECPTPEPAPVDPVGSRLPPREELTGVTPPLPMAPGRLAETGFLGVRNLARYKLRSFLTTLGIVFGIGAVVSMMSVAAGASRELLDQIQQLGITNILIESVRPPESTQSQLSQSSWVKNYGLTERDVRVLRGTVPGLLQVVRGQRVLEKAYLGNKNLNPEILGVEPSYFQALHIDVASGRALSDLDEANLACVCVVGPMLYRELGGVGDALNRDLRVGEIPFRVCGVLGGPDQGSEATRIYIPYATAVHRFGTLQIRMGSGSAEASMVEVSNMVLRCKSRDDVVPAALVTEHVMKRLHRDQDYKTTVPLRLLEQARQTQRIFQVVMILIAGISLVVGGIGIANIMFASVMERTREIGIRRALGARRVDILFQFLTETVLIALVGGIVGCLAGIGGSLAIARFTNWPFNLEPWSFVLALVISAGIGIVSGVAPARRAAKLDPVAALRHE